MLYKALKYTKSPACRTFAPDPTGGAYSASKTPSWWGGEHILSKNPTPLSPADIESRNGEVESWQPTPCCEKVVQVTRHKNVARQIGT